MLNAACPVRIKSQGCSLYTFSYRSGSSPFTEKNEIEMYNLSHITFDPSFHPLFHIKATEVDVLGS